MSIDRRAARREYKTTHRPMGIYQVKNLENGKLFIGSSVNLPAIFNRLRMGLRTGGHRKQPKLQQDWKEMGEEAFEMTVLEELEPTEDPGWTPDADLDALLSLWLEQLEPYGERGYNRRPKTP